MANTQTKKKKPQKAARKTKKPAAKKSAVTRRRKKKGTRFLSFILSMEELLSTLIFVAGILMLIIMLFPGTDGSVWNKIHTFYFAVLGVTGLYLPLAVLFLGIVKVMDKQKKIYVVKFFELLWLFLIICGTIHINTFAKLNPDMTYGEAVKQVFSEITVNKAGALSNGGVVGAVFGGALYQLGRSRFIANIFSVIFLIADIMLLFGITLFNLFTEMEKPARKVTTYTGEAIVNAKTDIEKKKNNYLLEREQRRSQSRSDPTRIAADFYRDNPDTPNNATGKTTAKAAPAPETAPASEAPESGTGFPVFSGEIRSIFEREEMKADRPARNVSSPAEKSEDIRPLTDEEKNGLKNELSQALESKPAAEYRTPSVDCLNPPVTGTKNNDAAELKTNGERLIAALNSFNVQATIVGVVPGPTVTRYELSPAPGVKISKFVGLSDDLALHMASPAGLRIEAPIPNKSAIGIEIPNKNKITVTFREVIDNEKFRNAKSKLNVALGKDISGDIIFSDLAKMPHLLVAGTTGSGKSVCLNTMIMSILYNAAPDEVKIILIDPKQVEFGVYNGLPHLLVPVVSDPRKASGALGWAVTEMLSRYHTLNENGVRDIGAYNRLCESRTDLARMPQIVIFIDELSDLMTVAPAEVEDSIQRLAQMARAAGMHLVVATQRPSVDVITGVIKANIPSRIALTVKSQIDSRTIIDSAGAEKLMGNGDMLYYPVGVPKPIRVQGAYLSDKEIENVVGFIKSNATATYDDAVQEEIERQAAAEKKKGGSGSEEPQPGGDKNDDLLTRAVELFLSAPEKASISALQRHLSLGFAKAGRLMDMLEEKGIVGPTEGSKPRKVLITKAQWYEMNALSSSADFPARESDFEEVSLEDTYLHNGDE